MTALQRHISGLTTEQIFVRVFALLILGSVGAAAVTGQPVLAGLPAGVLLLYLTVVDFRKVWFLLLFLMAFSVEVSLPGGLGTDLPNEPLMVLLTPIYLVYVIREARHLKGDFIRHPLSLLILLHLGWIFLTTATSGDFVISLKWMLAKTWYIIPFYFMTGSFIKTHRDAKKMMWALFVPLLLVLILTLVRHAMIGFSFEEVNYVMKPFFRNHVNYAAISVLFLPVLWFLRYDYRLFSRQRIFIGFGIIVFLAAVQFSYTRAAYVTLILSIGAYFIIRFKLMRYVTGLIIIGLIAGLTHLFANNKFLDYAPDFNKTVSHTNFDNLLEATAKGEDISTMERVYRWVAGYYMVLEKPLVGFGPGSFYSQYKGYTVTSFKTYVSRNEEKSTVHCYYLLVFAEQGVPGGLIFLVLVFAVLLYGEKIYHETLLPERRRMVMAMLLVFIIIGALNLINDLIEADKVGPFFFISIAVMVNADLRNREKKAAARLAEEK